MSTSRRALARLVRLASLATLATALALAAGVAAAPPERLRLPAPHVTNATRPVDLVICLDTSNSMDDLLDSARSRIWDIVNQLAKMEPTPELRVGLLTFGSPVPSAAERGWVVKQIDLSDDLDTVYGKLMALGTDGGDEYVGWVLREAVNTMDWAPDPDGLRLVFVAGNESADQGVEDVDFRSAARDARDDDIVINAIYAGPREQGATEKWHEVAQAGGGNFSAIDVAAGLLQVPTPFDQKLLDENARLNGTYLPYGELGETGLANQVTQDSNATRLGVQSCSSRIVAKGTALYTNSAWDLVDATLDEGFQWSSLRDADLPEALRSMTQSAREAHVGQLRSDRESIQTRIQSLSEKRELYLRAERDKALAGASSLDDAMRGALIAQAKAKGFRCDGC